jgi:hypothetical protein
MSTNDPDVVNGMRASIMNGSIPYVPINATERIVSGSNTDQDGTRTLKLADSTSGL